MMKQVLEAMRPRHWVKSGFCLAALFFSGSMTSLEAWGNVLPLLVVFSLISSAGYVVNDLWNLEEDRNHPRKRKRAIARGALSTKGALITVGVLYMGAIGLSFFMYGGTAGTWCVIGYVGLNLTYTFLLRRVPVLDVFAISFGFVLRVMGGAYVIGVAPSEWLMGLTYFLALLLGVGKRKGEIRFIDKSAGTVGSTRRSLGWYQGDFSSVSIIVVASALFVSYCLYCVVVQKGFPFIISAVPVGVALSSYVRAAGRSTEVEVPEQMLMKKSVILSAFCVWVVMVVVLVY